MKKTLLEIGKGTVEALVLIVSAMFVGFGFGYGVVLGLSAFRLLGN